MLPEFRIAMSVPAASRMASATKSPMLVSPERSRMLVGVERHARRADDRIELLAEPVLVRRHHGGRSRIVGDVLVHREQFEEPLDRAVGRRFTSRRAT